MYGCIPNNIINDSLVDIDSCEPRNGITDSAANMHNLQVISTSVEIGHV